MEQTRSAAGARRWRRMGIIVAVGALLALAACSSDSDDTAADDGNDDATEQTTTLRIGYSAWPGWFPLAVAEEAGIFEDVGLDVELTFFADYTASLDALVAEQLDVNAQTLNDTIFAVASGAEQRIVIVGDNSTGNDQVICDESITTVEDLRGKSIAAETGVVTHFLLLQGLAEADMSEDDIEFSGVATDAAAAAFAGGQFDCVAVFAPFTVQALERPGSAAVFTSADFPGAIPDHLVATAAAAEDTEAMTKLIEAWYATLAYIEEHPDEAVEIMAEKAQLTVEEYESLQSGTTLFDAATALDAFEDRPGDPTSLPEMARRINPFLVSSGLTEQEADLEGLFLPSFTEAFVAGNG